MNCDQVQSLLPDYWQDSLDRESSAGIQEHLAVCESCRLDAEMWTRLEAFPGETPSAALSVRLREMLAAYRVGKDHAEQDQFRKRRSLADWLRSYWPSQPAAQFAITAAALVLGVFFGYGLAGGAGRSREIADLRQELRSTRELVAVSLLRQESASDRLRGVNYSYRITHPDQAVVGALLQALEYDPAVDVRLSALDALRRFSVREDVRRGFLAAAEKDDSPMVQAAVIDTLVDLRDPSTLPVLQQLAKSAEVNPIVRQRIERARQVLERPR